MVADASGNLACARAIRFPTMDILSHRTAPTDICPGAHFVLNLITAPLTEASWPEEVQLSPIRSWKPDQDLMGYRHEVDLLDRVMETPGTAYP